MTPSILPGTPSDIAYPTIIGTMPLTPSQAARIATEYREWFTYHGSRPELSGVAAVVEFGFERMQQAQGVMPADAAELVVENARLRTELAKHQPPPDPVERVTE